MGRTGTSLDQNDVREFSLTNTLDWLGAFAKACTDVNRPLIDISERWKPYVPSWYGNSSTISIRPVTTAVTSTAAAAAVNNSKPALRGGAIAGIAIGSLAAIALFLSLSCWAWRNHKKAKRNESEKATLADAMHPDGVQARIDEIKYGTSTSSPMALSFSDRTKSPLQPAPLFSHPDACGNVIQRTSEERYGPLRSRNGAVLESNYDPTTPMEEHYMPAPLNLRIPKSQDFLGTAAVQHDAHATYKPTSLDRSVGVGRSSSHRLRPRNSQDSMGTTAVTTSPVQRYSFDPYGRAEYDEFGQKITYR
jgi:hypothetical protein